MDLFAQKLKEKASSTRAINESFFIGFGDPRLNEGKNFFSLKISPDELRFAEQTHYFFSYLYSDFKLTILCVAGPNTRKSDLLWHKL